MTPLENSRANGKAIVVGVFSSFSTMTLFLVLFGAQKFDTTTDVVAFIIQSILTAGLFYALWIGRSWARWLFASLAGLGVAFVLWVLMRTPSWQLVLFAAYFSAIIAALVLPKEVGAFIAAQKEKRQRPNQAPEPTALIVTPPAAQEPRQ